MAITVDQESLDAAELGLGTVGQLLGRVAGGNRLIVRLLIDGEAPDLANMEMMKSTPIGDRAIFIETADPRQTALEALDQAESQLHEADELKSQAADLLRASQWTPALDKLSRCLQGWINTQQTISTVAKLLKIDLETILVAGRPLSRQLLQFADQLRQIQSALQAGDLVGLTDLLVYETADTAAQWTAAINALRVAIEPQ